LAGYQEIMAQGYGNDQPQGFRNRIEKIAIIGVRLPV
jgi:hypothetical protein